MRYLICVLIAVISFSSYSVAADGFCESNHGKENCDNAALLRRDYERLDQELNKVYSRALANHTYIQKNYLRQSQKSWLKFRKLECDSRHAMLNSGDSVLLSNVWQGCMNEFTELRVNDLKRWY